ncbi:MAG: hypothetical protein V5A18_10500 [Haloarculaceae archaeon]
MRALTPDAEEAVLFVHDILTNARALFDTPAVGDDSDSWLHGAAERRVVRAKREPRPGRAAKPRDSEATLRANGVLVSE